MPSSVSRVDFCAASRRPKFIECFGQFHDDLPRPRKLTRWISASLVRLLIVAGGLPLDLAGINCIRHTACMHAPTAYTANSARAASLRTHEACYPMVALCVGSDMHGFNGSGLDTKRDPSMYSSSGDGIRRAKESMMMIGNSDKKSPVTTGRSGESSPNIETSHQPILSIGKIIFLLSKLGS